MKKRDVGMANTSLKSTGTRYELSITLYLQSEINFCSVRMLVNAWCYIPTSLPQKQVAKIKWLILAYDWPHTHAPWKVLHLLYRKEITYTLQSRFCKLTTGLLMLNVLIQIKIIQYWWWFWRQWCRDVASGIDKHPDRTEIYFRLQIQGNRKLIPCSCTF